MLKELIELQDILNDNSEIDYIAIKGYMPSGVYLSYLFNDLLYAHNKVEDVKEMNRKLLTIQLKSIKQGKNIILDSYSYLASIVRYLTVVKLKEVSTKELLESWEHYLINGSIYLKEQKLNLDVNIYRQP